MIQYPIAVGGVTTRVLEGRPRGTDGHRANVVLLHGLGARADRWRKNIDVLASAGYRTLALDLPGHGLAQKGRMPYSVPFYAEFVKAFIAEAGLDCVALVGTSLGGHVASYAVVDDPTLAKALVLVGAVGVIPLGQVTRQRIGAQMLDISRDGIKEKFLRLFDDPALATDELVEEEYRINTSPGAREAAEVLSHYFRTNIDEHVVGPALADRVTTLRTLLVWGTSDHTVPLAVGHQVHELLVGSTLETIEGAAHAPYFECDETFNRLLVKFLAETMGVTP